MTQHSASNATTKEAPIRLFDWSKYDGQPTVYEERLKAGNTKRPSEEPYDWFAYHGPLGVPYNKPQPATVTSKPQNGNKDQGNREQSSLSNGRYDDNQTQAGDHSVRSLIPGSSDDRDRSLEEAQHWFRTDARDLKYINRIIERENIIGDSLLKGIQELGQTQPQGQVQEQKPRPLPIGHGRRTTSSSTQQTPPSTTLSVDGQACIELMGPAIANLHSYVDGSQPDYFSRYARPPEWCFDKTPGGNKSFFGEDWGAPPPRVGRDPRYQTTIHEGRPTYFEEVGRVRGREWGRR